MNNQNKIGALIILGGIALLGYVYFKKNKPTVASSQARELEALSNYYKTGAGANEETIIEGKGVNLQNTKNDRYGGLFKLSDKELEKVESSIATIGMPTINFQNVDWSNIKI